MLEKFSYSSAMEDFSVKERHWIFEKWSVELEVLHKSIVIFLFPFRPDSPKRGCQWGRGEGEEVEESLI
jgi:hypothetical protein